MRSDRLLLQDMLDAIETSQQYLPVNADLFHADPPLQSHIYRQIVIIGEAAHRLSKTLKERNPDVPWREIEGMRHVLVHDICKWIGRSYIAPPQRIFPLSRRSCWVSFRISPKANKPSS